MKIVLQFCGSTETVHPDVVVGAGGAHSVTRHSMSEYLEGSTYKGHFLVAATMCHRPRQGGGWCVGTRRMPSYVSGVERGGQW